MMAPFDEKEVAIGRVDEVIAGTKDYDSLLVHEKLMYDRVMYDRENPKKDVIAWSSMISASVFREITKNNTVLVSGVFYGKTPTMARKWVNLKKLEDETFVQIIMGSKPLDAFDQFVADWKRLGGDEVTGEVREAVK